jgi:copper chaperone CopZ
VNELLLSVPDMSCDHCVRAITAEVSCVPGVDGVDVQLPTKTVRVSGPAAEAAVREAIAEAGYEAA